MKKIIPNDAQSPEQNRRLEGNKPSKDIFGNLRKRQKPQISSILGVSPKEPRRYQVTIADEVIATGLTSDEALAVAKGAR
jgi:hypothetical protein